MGNQLINKLVMSLITGIVTFANNNYSN